MVVTNMKGHHVLFDFPRKTVKLILMARYGMLDCANNYHGKYGTKMCKECNVVDDENHRLNFCGKWRHVNLYGKGMMIDFETVYSEDKDVLRQVSTLLESVWNVENGKMRCIFKIFLSFTFDVRVETVICYGVDEVQNYLSFFKVMESSCKWPRCTYLCPQYLLYINNESI